TVIQVRLERLTANHNNEKLLALKRQATACLGDYVSPLCFRAPAKGEDHRDAWVDAKETSRISPVEQRMLSETIKRDAVWHDLHSAARESSSDGLLSDPRGARNNTVAGASDETHLHQVPCTTGTRIREDAAVHVPYESDPALDERCPCALDVKMRE